MEQQIERNTGVILAYEAIRQLGSINMLDYYALTPLLNAELPATTQVTTAEVRDMLLRFMRDPQLYTTALLDARKAQ